MVDIGGTTIYFGLRIKLRTRLIGLNDKYKADLRSRLSKLRFVFIDELSKASSDYWTDIDSRLGERITMISEKVFDGVSVLTVTDFL